MLRSWQRGVHLGVHASGGVGTKARAVSVDATTRPSPAAERKDPKPSFVLAAGVSTYVRARPDVSTERATPAPRSWPPGTDPRTARQPPRPGGAHARWLLQVEDGLQGQINAPLFLDGEVTVVVTEPAHIDCAGLLNEHASH